MQVARLGGIGERVLGGGQLQRTEHHDLGLLLQGRAMEEDAVHVVETDRAAPFDLVVAAVLELVLRAAGMHDLVVPVARDVAHVHERVAAAFQHGASFCFLLLERRVDDDVPRFEEVAHPHHLLHVLGAVAVAPLVVLEHDRLLRAGRQGHRVTGVGRAAEPVAEGVPVRLVRKRRADGVIGLVRRREDFPPMRCTSGVESYWTQSAFR